MVFRPLGGVFHRHPVFNTMALDSGDAAVGVLSYNADKDTFDLTHKDGVVQQLGQEIYGHFINNTAATVDRTVAAQTDREALKRDLIVEHYRTRADWMRAGGFWLMLGFAAPLMVWWAAVLVYPKARGI